MSLYFSLIEFFNKLFCNVFWDIYCFKLHFLSFIILIVFIYFFFFLDSLIFFTYFWFSSFVVRNSVKFLWSVLIINGFIILCKNALYSFSAVTIANNSLLY